MAFSVSSERHRDTQYLMLRARVLHLIYHAWSGQGIEPRTLTYSNNSQVISSIEDYWVYTYIWLNIIIFKMSINKYASHRRVCDNDMFFCKITVDSVISL